jgi:hypothetical protein
MKTKETNTGHMFNQARRKLTLCALILDAPHRRPIRRTEAE